MIQLEGFLIANRDEYLKHSSKNYTMEQKQYNNWLTERLMEVAHKHHYVFDKDDFNFVAIRDRIRCYYKSYVQTARKRGLPLPVGIRTKDPEKSDVEDEDDDEVDEDDKGTTDVDDAKAEGDKDHTKDNSEYLKDRYADEDQGARPSDKQGDGTDDKATSEDGTVGVSVQSKHLRKRGKT